MSVIKNVNKITPSGNIRAYSDHLNELLDRFESPDDIDTLLDLLCKSAKKYASFICQAITYGKIY